MSDFEPEIVQPPETGDPLAFEAWDPFGLAQQRQQPGYQAHGAQQAWSWLMYTMGRRAPANLAKSARTREAMLKLRSGRRRIR